MNRLAIIGCGAAKLGHAAPARELYAGCLFRAARQHVEAAGLPWLILSALHGLVEPAAVRAPDAGPLAAPPRERARPSPWPGTGQGYLCGVRGKMLRAVWQYTNDIPQGRWPRGTPVVVEVHAGALYVEAVTLANAYPELITVEAPLAGLEIGERLRWYAERRRAPMLFPALAAGNQTGLCVA